MWFCQLDSSGDLAHIKVTNAWLLKSGVIFMRKTKIFLFHRLYKVITF